MKCINLKCNASLQDGSIYCDKCGARQTEPAVPGGSMDPSSDFIYLLDQEKLRTETAKDMLVPYGCFAVSVVNGQVQKVHLATHYEGNKGNIYKDWLKSLWEVTLGVGGQKEQDVKTFVVMDLRDLPVITHSHPIPIPGLPGANLRFELWVDPLNNSNLGVLLQRCMGNRRSLTFNDLKAVAVESIPQLLTNFALASLATDPASAASIGKTLERATGISSKCYFAKGKVSKRKQLEVSKFQKPVICNKCSAEYSTFTKFCDDCGANLSNLDWASGVSYLQASGGEPLTLRLRWLEDDSQNDATDKKSGDGADKEADAEAKKKAEDDLSELVLFHLEPILRRYDVASLMNRVMLTQLSSELNTQLLRDKLGYCTEFEVTDLRTAQEEWFFKTEALVADELRKVESRKKMLPVKESELDLAEMYFALQMREIREKDTEELTLRRQALEARSKIADAEVDEQALETSTELRKETIEDEAHKQRLAREKDKMLRERDVKREMTSGDHQDDLTQLDHDITLEKKVAQHDIDQNEMVGEAESRARRRGISDDSFEEDEAIRLAAKAQEQLGNIDEDLEDRKKNRRVEELRVMAEIKANTTAQEQAHELNKTKEENALARDKIDAMKNRSAAEILAMQAVELTAKGASADMISGITNASSGVKIAEAKEAATRELLAMQKEMMQLMMAQQNQSSVREAEALKLAVNVAQSTNEKSMDSMMQVAKVSAAESSQGYKEAANISKSVNEKSMDSMARVATAAAGKKITTSTDDAEKVLQSCYDKECSGKYEGKPLKCSICGLPKPPKTPEPPEDQTVV